MLPCRGLCKITMRKAPQAECLEKGDPIGLLPSFSRIQIISLLWLPGSSEVTFMASVSHFCLPVSSPLYLDFYHLDYFVHFVSFFWGFN